LGNRKRKERRRGKRQPPARGRSRKKFQERPRGWAGLQTDRLALTREGGDKKWKGRTDVTKNLPPEAPKTGKRYG